MQTPKTMKRRDFNKKLLLASLGITMVDIKVIGNSCSCGGECYKMAKLMAATNELEFLRQSMCLYITNEKKLGRWDMLEQFVLYQEPFLDKNTNKFIDWKSI